MTLLRAVAKFCTVTAVALTVILPPQLVRDASATPDIAATPASPNADSPRSGAGQSGKIDRPAGMPNGERIATAAPPGKDWQGCEPSPNAEARIGACKRLIASATVGKKDLATAHRWLGDAYRAQAYQNRNNEPKSGDLFDDMLAKIEGEDRVLEAYNKAIELNPDDPETYNRRASLHGNAQIEKAIADYSKAIELGTTDTGPFYERSKYYKAKGKLDLAIADMSGAIALQPFGMNYRSRGVLHHATGAYENAIADYNAALGLDASKPLTGKASKSDQAKYYHLRGLAYLELGNGAQALADYNTSAGLVPANLMLQHNRAIAYSNINDFDTAIAEFTKIIATASKPTGTLRDELAEKQIRYRDLVAPSYAYRGLAHALAGRQADGLADAEQALVLDPDNVPALVTRGLINEARGDKDKAIADFRKVYAIDPKRAGIQAALDRLGTLSE